jgi:hypothetical protein
MRDAVHVAANYVVEREGPEVRTAQWRLAVARWDTDKVDAVRLDPIDDAVLAGGAEVTQHREIERRRVPQAAREVVVRRVGADDEDAAMGESSETLRVPDGPSHIRCEYGTRPERRKRRRCPAVAVESVE